MNELIRQMIVFACCHVHDLHTRSPAEFFVFWQREQKIGITNFTQVLRLLSLIRGLRAQEEDELMDLLEHIEE